MPKASKHPRFRTHVKRGRNGQAWVSYWFDNRGRGKPDTPLGTDYAEALRRWHELYFDAPRIAGTLEEAFRAWEGEALPEYANANTRHGYSRCLQVLRPVFGPARWEDVTLPALVQYLKTRTAKTRGKHELRVLSIVWNWARLQGLTSLPYPAHGMQRSGWMGKTKAREREVTDSEFAALYKHADQTLRDALDIATATGLRVLDVVALRITDVQAGALVVKASKTGKIQRFSLDESAVLPPIIKRRQAVKAEHFFLLTAGRRQVTYRRLSDRFVKARAAAAKEVPSCASLWLRDMRKRASQLPATLAEAQALLGHDSPTTTRRHYRQAENVKPAR